MQKRFKKLGASAAAALLAVTASCGGTVPFGAAAADKPQLSYSVLAGGSQIGLKFKVTPPEGGTASDYGLLVNGDPYSLTDGVYGFGVNAAEMAEPITVAVTKGTTIAVAEQTVSVSGFLQTITDDAAYGDVAKAMLNYGYAAQDFFGSAAPADYGLTAAPDFSGLTISESAFANKTEFNSALADTAVQYYGMNLTLLDQIRFSLYFSNTGEQADAISYLGNSKFGGETATAYDISQTFSRIYATVPASKLSEQLKFENGSVSETFSPVQYLAAASTGDDAKLAALCKALYAYGEAAKNTSSVEPQDPEKWESEDAHSGKATFYDYGGAYPVGNALLDDFIEENNMNIAALTDDDYHKYVGGFIKVQRGEKSVCALVGDIMPFDDNPNAHAGDVDLNEDAFPEIANKTEGKVDITWQLIPLPTAAEAPISYAVKEGSNKYWAGIQVRNTTYPVAKLEWSADGTSFTEIKRMDDCYNYFVIEPNGKTNLTFRITDIFGQVVTDENVTLPLTETDSAAVQLVPGGGVQFPK